MTKHFRHELTRSRLHLALLVTFVASASFAMAESCAGHIGRSDVVHESVPTDMMMGKIVEMRAPVYPEPARQGRIEGTVTLRINVDPEGCPVGAIVISGPAALTQAALSAVFQWRFRPTFVNGAATWVYTVVPINFSLHESEASMPNVAHTLIRLKSGRTIAADSVREMNNKIEYTQGDQSYGIPNSLVAEITRPTTTTTPNVKASPARTFVVTPQSAAPPPASLVGDWPPYESTENIRRRCLPEASGAGPDDLALGARSCAIWNLEMGAEYDALVDRGIELRRKMCAAGKVTILNLQDQMQLLDEWGRVRGELIRRQSIDRFDRVRSARITADYNRMSVSCPK